MTELRQDDNFRLLKLSELNPIQSSQDIKKSLPASLCPGKDNQIAMKKKKKDECDSGKRSF